MSNEEYYTCKTCGANLDIGEACEDCLQEHDHAFVETRVPVCDNDIDEEDDNY